MEKFIFRMCFFMLSLLSFGVMGMDLPTGELTCQYTYTDSDDENESSETHIKFESDEDGRTMYAETETSDMDGSNKKMVMLPILAIPHAKDVKLNEEVSSGFDTITMKKFSENKKSIKFTYELFGHWYNQSVEKVKITKDKNGLNIVINSKSVVGNIFDRSEDKFSSSAKYVCRY